MDAQRPNLTGVGRYEIFGHLSCGKAKLAEKHRVTPQEVEQCFLNREGPYLVDNREEHASDPATLWFLAETDTARQLKVMFIPYPEKPTLRSAYEPSQQVIDLYSRLTSQK